MAGLMAAGIPRSARDISNSALDAAVAASITEVNGHADHQPYDQAHPCFPWKVRHEIAGDHNSQDRHKRNHGSLEGTLKIGIPAADDPHARANDHECQQRSDVDHVAQQVDGQRGCQQRYAGANHESGNPWRAEFGVNGAEDSGQESVARHGEEDARLPQQHDHNRAAQAHERADFDHQTAPADAGFVDAHGERIANVEEFVIDQTAKNADDQNIEDRADHQRTKDADRHVAGWILGFLRRGGDSVETDIGEKDDGSAAADAGPSILAAHAGVGRHERMPVDGHQFRMLQQVISTQDHKHNQDANFDIDDCGVEVGRLFDSDNKNQRGDHDGEEAK